MRYYVWIILLGVSILYFLASLTGCQSIPVGPPVEPLKIVLPWDGKHAESAKWTEVVIAEIKAQNLPQFIPADIATFCPKYEVKTEGDRLVFWANLISIMAKYESGFNPHEIYHEPAPLNTDSIGLLQLSYGDQSRYPFCGLDRAKKNLEDASVNLKCGVGILAKLAKENNRLAGKVSGAWKGGARYWSVLRYDRNSYQPIVAHVKALGVCQ